VKFHGRKYLAPLTVHVELVLMEADKMVS